MKHRILLPLFVLMLATACSRTGNDQEQAVAPTQNPPTPTTSAPATSPATLENEHSEHGQESTSHDSEHEHAGAGHEESGHVAGGHEHGDHSYSYGQPGKAEAATRTVNVIGGDDMRFQPATLDVKAGQTVKFIVKNTGKIRHEFALGDEASQKKHAEMMKQMPDMVHEEANALTLEPGQEKTLIWQFTQAGSVEFACHVPGHYEAGMKGVVEVAN